MTAADRTHNRISAIRRGAARLGRWATGAILMALLVLWCAKLSARAEEVVKIPVEVAYDSAHSEIMLPDEAFRIELTDAEGHAQYRDITLTNSVRSGKVGFELIPGTGGAANTYTLRELTGATPGMRYSDRIYTIAVSLSPEGEPVLRVTDNHTGADGKPADLRFNNLYEGPGESIGDPPVRAFKRISGDKPAQTDTFYFAMTPEFPEYPLQEGSENGRKVVSVRGEGEVEFGDIRFTEPGIYRYFVTEIDDGTPGYTYDKSIFTVIYTVTRDASGAMHTDRQIIHALDTVNSCTFTNEYSAAGDPRGREDDGPDGTNGRTDRGTNGSGTVSGVIPGLDLGLAGILPKTGDDSQVGLYAALTAISLLAIFLILFLWRRKRADRKEGERDE